MLRNKSYNNVPIYLIYAVILATFVVGFSVSSFLWSRFGYGFDLLAIGVLFLSFIFFIFGKSGSNLNSNGKN